MRYFNRTKFRTFIVVMLLVVSAISYGQVQMAEVVETFNKGVKLMKINPDEAISSFQKAISLADQVGTEADSIKGKAIKQIPNLHWEMAKKFAGKKDYESAIEKLSACVASATTASDESLIKRAKSTTLSILNAQGNYALSKKEYEMALSFYDKALAQKPSYTKALLGKTLAYNSMGKFQEMEEVGIQGIELAKQTKDSKTASAIQQKLRTSFYNSAQSKLKTSDFSGAEKHLSKSIEYGNNTALTYYQLGLAYESQKKWSMAIKSFNKYVEMNDASGIEKAKVFYKLGAAYEAMGNNEKACDSYKKVKQGEFAEASKYKIEKVLKCDS